MWGSCICWRGVVSPVLRTQAVEIKFLGDQFGVDRSKEARDYAPRASKILELLKDHASPRRLRDLGDDRVLHRRPLYNKAGGKDAN